MKLPPRMPQGSMVRIWVASLHQELQRYHDAGVSVLSELHNVPQGWIRTAAARRFASRREKTALRAVFSSAACDITRAHQQIQCRDTLDFCFTQNLKFRLQGWIRTASTRRIVRRGKKPLRGFFRCAACEEPAPIKSSSIRTGCWSFCFICVFSSVSARDYLSQTEI